jgi:hypothetical protein
MEVETAPLVQASDLEEQESSEAVVREETTL